MKAEAGRILSVHNLNLHIAVSVIRKDLIQVDCADKRVWEEKLACCLFPTLVLFCHLPPHSSTKVAQTFEVIGVKNMDTMLIIKLEDVVILGPGQIGHYDILNFLIHFCIDFVIPSLGKEVWSTPPKTPTTRRSTAKKIAMGSPITNNLNK